MRHAKVAVTILASALATLGVQVAALVYLKVNDYGLFALAFLFFGFSLSVANSLLVDVRIRRNELGDPEAQREPTFWIALALALSLSSMAWAFGLPGESASLLGTGIFAGVLRHVFRAEAVVREHWAKVVYPDFLVTPVFLLTVWAYASSLGVNALVSLLLAWSTSLLVAAAMSWRHVELSPVKSLSWLSLRRDDIRGLLSDSLALDAGVLGAPLVVSQLLAPYQFAVFRAVSSALIPVRMVLVPMRPWLSARSMDHWTSARVRTSYVALAVVFCVSIPLALWAVGGYSKLSESVIPRLAEVAIPVGIAAGAQFLGFVAWVASRTHASLRSVGFRRIFDTSSLICFPVVGALLGGTEGAVWGYAVSSGVTVVLWGNLLMRVPGQLSRAEALGPR